MGNGLNMKPDYVYKDGPFKVIKEMGFKGKPIFIVTELIKYRSTDKRRFQYHYMDYMKSSLDDAIKFIEELKRDK